MFSEVEFESFDLDSQVKLLRFAYSLDNWRQLATLSEKLYQNALQTYNLTRITENPIEEVKLERPILYYVGYSKLMEGIACQKIYEYKKARECIEVYANWSWVKQVSEKDQNEISVFTQLSKINTIVLDIFEGDDSQVDDYVAIIKHNKQELTAGLLTLLEANRLNQLDIHQIEKICKDHVQLSVAKSFHQNDIPLYLKFLYEYALYMIDSSSSDAIQVVLKCFLINVKINKNHSLLIKYVALFEKLRVNAGLDEIEKYQYILGEVIQDEKIQVDL